MLMKQQRAYDELQLLAVKLREIGWQESAVRDLYEMAALIIDAGTYFDALPGVPERAIANALGQIAAASYAIAERILATKEFEHLSQATGSAGADQSKPH
jgi:hypothetical protein